jgi:hypothetical protein
MKFRLRFSVRMLALFMTLVCAYFGAWDFTCRISLPYVNKICAFAYHRPPNSPAPFIVVVGAYGAIALDEKLNPMFDTPPDFWFCYLCFGRASIQVWPLQTFGT